MNRPDDCIDHFRARLLWVLLGKHTIALATFWTFLWGGVMLVLRGTTHLSAEIFLWGAAALPVCLIGAAVLARRQLPSRNAVRALLDGENHLGGLLMASAEVDVGQWQDSLRVERMPAVRWQSRRASALLLFGVGFVVAGFLAPQRFATAGREAPLEVGHQVRRVKEQVQVLKEEKFLETARAEEMQSKLERLREEARGGDPARALEAIDRIQDVAKMKAREAAEAAVKRTEALSKTESLADVLRKKKSPQNGGLSDKSRSEAMQELARLTREALKENEKLAGQLDPELLRDLKGARLTPEQMEKLREALKEGKQDIEKMLGKLEKAGLIDRASLHKAAEVGQCDGEGLLEYLKRNEGKASLKELVRQHNLPGRGGVSRGPGPAEISFGEESADLRERMKAQTLPPTRLDALKESKINGISRGDPRKDQPGGETTSGALSGSAGGNGSAQTEIILPRHRGAVERYFERGEKK